MPSSILGLITARGASKGIKRKNLAPLAGKPLIAWTIEAALKSRVLDRVIVSTDNAEIVKTAREWKAEVPFIRPSYLAADTSSHIAVVQHAVEWMAEHEKYKPDYVMLLQPTSPLRTKEDIIGATKVAFDKKAAAVVSVCEAEKHPLKMFNLQENGTLVKYTSSNIDYLRRQDLSLVYEENGAIYLNRCESLIREQTFFPMGTYPFIMPKERSVDIDTMWDLFIAEMIIKEQYI